jgi:Flp pilus assembly protein TadG
MLTKCRRMVRLEDGATAVEMAISFSILIAMMFAIIQLSFALYAYNAVNAASREAARYAVVRGSPSCTILSTFPNCNLGPTTTGNPLQTYVQGIGLPLSQGMTVTSTWWAASLDSSGSATWTTACTTLQDSNLNYCNQPGNQVKVVVTYAFPIAIPFVTRSLSTINLSSTSELMISD